MINYQFAILFGAWMLFIPAISMFIWGIHSVTKDGYLLAPLRRGLERILPEWAMMPLLICPICMSSVWTVVLGLPFAMYFLNLGWGIAILHTVLIVFNVAGLNSIIVDWLYKEPQAQPVPPLDAQQKKCCDNTQVNVNVSMDRNDYSGSDSFIEAVKKLKETLSSDSKYSSK